MEKYSAIMEEIKRRVTVIDHYISGKRDAIYVPTNVETVGLQFRKIFELIAFASLAANKQKYSAAYADFSTHWRAAKLVANLQRLNPDFYPKPVQEVKSDLPDVTHDLRDREQDYLSQADLIEAHGKCGTLLHAANPFGRSIDYGLFQKCFPIWKTKITNLLNTHKVHLVDDTGFYLFHMYEKEKGEKVPWYRFELVGPTVSPHNPSS